MMKKGRGVESSAVVSLHGERGGDLTWTAFLPLGPLEAALSATVGKGRISRMHLVLDVPKVEGLSRLFFFDDGEARGDLKADLHVEDLPYPVTKLPVMQGYLTFRGDILHPSALANAPHRHRPCLRVRRRAVYRRPVGAARGGKRALEGASRYRGPRGAPFYPRG